MKKGISQEGLKLLACVSMLLDHIGYALVSHMPDQLPLYYMLRIMGRIAFPIYAFLLAEGFFRTRSRENYLLRLLFGAVLAEVPYDLMVHGTLTLAGQSVMVTLTLAFLALWAMEKCGNFYLKPLAALPFLILAELAACDYGWQGVALVAVFAMSRSYSAKNLIRFGGMLVLFETMGSMALQFGNMAVSIQSLGILSMLFIAGYDGRKVTTGRGAQWAFYLFYPVHMLILFGLEWLLYGGYFV